MEEAAQFAIASNAFGVDLFKTIYQKDNGANVALSPFSVSATLAMLKLGSRGTTSADISRVLRWDSSDASYERKLHEAFRDYLILLNSKSDGCQVACANRVYVDKEQNVQGDFKNAVKEMYMADPVDSDFQGNPEAERKSINSWVAEQTMNKIDNLLSPGSIISSTRLVLANALYFKGQWDTKFNERLTRPGPFKMAAGGTKNVPIMRAMGRFPFTRDSDLKCTAVGLPYAGKDLSMAIILPDHDLSLGEYVETLNDENLKTLFADMDKYPTKIHFSMPKFEVSSGSNLNNALSALGMASAFSQAEADLSGISPEGELYISTVEHKVYIQVDEEGTEAAAATAAVAHTFSMGPPSVDVDRPFLFAIRDNRAAGALLFLGSVNDPEA